MAPPRPPPPIKTSQNNHTSAFHTFLCQQTNRVFLSVSFLYLSWTVRTWAGNVHSCNEGCFLQRVLNPLQHRHIPLYTAIGCYIPQYTAIYHYRPLYTATFRYIPLYSAFFHISLCSLHFTYAPDDMRLSDVVSLTWDIVDQEYNTIIDWLIDFMMSFFAGAEQQRVGHRGGNPEDAWHNQGAVQLSAAEALFM